MFDSLVIDGSISSFNFFVILAVALLSGIVYACLSCIKSKLSKSFFIATALLPMAVAVVIALVNGNVGVGVAIAGAFSLVRFRSAAGSAKEIAIVFIAMAAGLAFGMGYCAYGALFLICSGMLFLLFDFIVNTKCFENNEKLIKITIPESLDYTNVFDEVFNKYTSKHELEAVKSVNMGSMFRVTFKVYLKDKSKEKEMIDEIRIRNGNLEVMVSRIDTNNNEL